MKRRYIKLTGQLSVYSFVVVCCFCLLFSGCISPEQSVVYVRTKNLKVSGIVTATLNLPVITVLWNFQEYKLHHEKKSFVYSGDEVVPVMANDCFRAELIYSGVNHNEALFEVRYYLCGRFEPVGTERFGVDLIGKKEMSFQGACLTLLNASPADAVVKIDSCENEDH
jgi:hypothetical protein